MPEKLGGQGHHSPEAAGDGHQMTAFGCFGKPPLLIRMLAKVLAQVEHRGAHVHAQPLQAAPFRHDARCLMARLSQETAAGGPLVLSADVLQGQVSGFFIYREGRRIRMNVYSRRKALPRLPPA